MAPPPLHVLTEADKNELLLAQYEMIARMAARISELEALIGKPCKTSKNRQPPLSKDDFGKGGGGKSKREQRPSREGSDCSLSEASDKIERIMAETCGHCRSGVSSQAQRCRHRYDHSDLPPIHPIVTRVGLYSGHSHWEGADRRIGTGLAAVAKAISDKLLTARVIAPDETTTRTNTIARWQWAFLSGTAVLHKISRRQAAEDVLAAHQPDVWIPDGYAGQQALGREALRWASRIGKPQSSLKNSILGTDAAKTDYVHTRLMQMPIVHPAGKVRREQIKACRGKLFVFLTNHEVPAPSTISKRNIRPSVVSRKVTSGFRSDRGAQIPADYRSFIETARLFGQSARSLVRSFVDGKFVIA